MKDVLALIAMLFLGIFLGAVAQDQRNKDSLFLKDMSSYEDCAVHTARLTGSESSDVVVIKCPVENQEH